MRTEATRTPTPLGTVFREEWRLVRGSGRGGMILLGVTGVLVYGGGLYARSRGGWVDSDTLLLDDAVLPLLLAVLWPVSVWKDEGWSTRTYHRALPVEPVRHDLLRVAAGGAWLLVLLGAMLAADVVFTAATTEGRWLLTIPAWQWIALAVVPLVFYLLASGPVVLSDHPRRWAVGAAVCVLLSRGDFQPAPDAPGWARALGSAMGTVVNGRLGLGWVVRGLAPWGVRDHLPSVDAAHWPAAALLWSGIAVAAAVLCAWLAARRRGWW